MHATTPIDEARAKFAAAFKAYAQAGNLMRDILIAHDAGIEGEDFAQALATQQQLLNEARDQYHQAREAYVQTILGVMNVPSESVDTGTTVNLSIQRR